MPNMTYITNFLKRNDSDYRHYIADEESSLAGGRNKNKIW